MLPVAGPAGPGRAAACTAGSAAPGAVGWGPAVALGCWGIAEQHTVGTALLSAHSMPPLSAAWDTEHRRRVGEEGNIGNGEEAMEDSGKFEGFNIEWRVIVSGESVLCGPGFSWALTPLKCNDCPAPELKDLQISISRECDDHAKVMLKSNRYPASPST